MGQSAGIACGRSEINNLPMSPQRRVKGLIVGSAGTTDDVTGVVDPMRGFQSLQAYLGP